MIQRITPEAISLTREPAHAFFKESGIDGKLNFSHFCQTWAKLIELDMAQILVYRDDDKTHATGIIGGTITPCTMTNDLIAMECFWWVSPKLRGGAAGIKLLKAWESLMITNGAKRLYVGNLVGLNNEMMHSIYTRLGYKPLETHYVKPV